VRQLAAVCATDRPTAARPAALLTQNLHLYVIYHGVGP